MKTWSYRTITEEAEEAIKHLMDDDARPYRQDWAYGVFLLWLSLTSGYRQDGDTDRLEALTKRGA